MGSLRLTLCTGILAAVTLIPTAHAAEGGGVSVTPSSPAPGADVALRVSGCGGRTATAVSDAFVSDITLAGTDGTLAGESRIRSSATPGRYDVRVSCGGARVQGTITVAAAGSGAEDPSAGLASPVAPVPAGGGGTADDGTPPVATGVLHAGETGPPPPGGGDGPPRHPPGAR
ncbi:hypothetical protein ACFW2E_07570, partial [Streptomyces sp. NPDC058964]